MITIGNYVIYKHHIESFSKRNEQIDFVSGEKTAVDKTVIYFSSGRIDIVDMPFEDFKKLME